MEVILRETVPNLGHAGDVVTVKNGYARNYLIPHGLAYVATAGNKRRIEREAARHVARLATEREQAQELAAKLEGLELHFTAKAGEGDRLFGSVTAGDIAAELDRLGYAVDKRHVELEEPLKLIGVFPVPVRLHADVRPTLRVWVVKES
jgi:large subunit ribosomal protein L9